MENINNLLDNMIAKLNVMLNEVESKPNILNFNDVKKEHQKVTKKITTNSAFKYKWRIDIKGYIDLEVVKEHCTENQGTDIKMGYGYIDYIGTENQLDAFLEPLYKDERYCKVIGIKRLNEEDIDHDQVYQDYINSKNK